jgi:hypothetical protein
MRRRSSFGYALTFAVVFAAGTVGAQEPAGAPAEEATPLVDSEAVSIASRAGDFLREAQRFSFSAESGYEVVQDDGSKLEFGSTRRYLVQRPNHVRVETEPREGDRRLTLFDGKTFIQADLGENVYARADLKQSRDIDFLIDLVRERLDSPLPLAELLRNNPRQATTYAVAPVASFGWLLLAMGASQCEADARRTRLAYLGVFALLIFYARAPWLGGG